MSFLLSRVNYSPHKNNPLEPKHSFPLYDPFVLLRFSIGVLEVFNEALNVFVYNLSIVLLWRLKLPDPLSCIRDHTTPRSTISTHSILREGLNKGGGTVRPSGASPSPGLAETSALVHTWIQKGSIPTDLLEVSDQFVYNTYLSSSDRLSPFGFQ